MARVVLVADDSPTIQKRALGILKGQGFEVETVSNGVAAIKRLAVLHPVVVLADVSMPGRDGYEVCEFVKKSPELSQVPVLLVASDMEPYDGPRGEQVGADGIIKKPFEARDLISIVEKFAEQFEAARIAIPVALVTPTAKPESAGAFPAFGEEPDVAPTLVQHVEQDFSGHAEGMAFAEPAGEEAHGFSYEPHPDPTEAQFNSPLADAANFPESVFEPPSALAEKQPLAAEAPAAPSPFAPSPAAPELEGVPSFPAGVEATTPEPVFLEEQLAHPPEPSHHSFEPHTMIFRAPMEIAEPVWQDDPVLAAPAPVSDGPMAFEPQHEAEVSSAPSETPTERPSAPSHNPPVVTATSLDSFPLDDAATGQVHFASDGSKVPHEEPVYSTPGEEIPATEIAPREATPVAVHAEAAAPEAAPEVVYSETTLSESVPEVVHMEIAPLEAVPEAVHAEAAPSDAVAELVYSGPAPPEAAPEVDYAETASFEAAPEAVHTEITPPGTAPEVISADAASPEAVPQTASPEPAAEVAPPASAFDWDSFYYSIVRKVVVRMSPPVLPAEVVEAIARRLAEEIAAEISSQSSQSPT